MATTNKSTSIDSSTDLQLASIDEDITRQMEIAEEVMREDRELLRLLAESEARDVRNSA